MERQADAVAGALYRLPLGGAGQMSEEKAAYRVNHDVSDDEQTQEALWDIVAAGLRRLQRPPDECIDVTLCVELGCCAAGCQPEPPDDPANFY